MYSRTAGVGNGKNFEKIAQSSKGLKERRIDNQNNNGLGMIKSAMFIECWTPQSSHRDIFFSIFVYLVCLLAR